MYATLTMPDLPEADAPRRSPTLRVRSAEDLRGALRQARSRGLTLDGSGLDRVLRVDLARGLVEVQAATSWRTLAEALASRGIALEAFAAADLPATLGEAIALAAPGPDGLPVTAHVTAATVATPDGELRRADRGAHRDLLGMVLGGQGVVGIPYSLTLSIDSLRASAAAARAPVALDLPGACGAGEAFRTTCLIPPGSLEDFLGDLRALASERRIPLGRINVRRTLPDGSSRLNWSKREWAWIEVRFGDRSTLGASVAAAETRRALLEAALSRGGSFPVRDLRDATRVQLERAYPELRGFLAEKRRCDPGERLQNAWYRDALAALRAGGCEVRWDRG